MSATEPHQLQAYLPVVASGVVSCAIGVCAAPRFRGGLRLAALAGVADGSRFAPVRRLALVRRLVAEWPAPGLDDACLS
jgi:hypothetical protein